MFGSKFALGLIGLALIALGGCDSADYDSNFFVSAATEGRQSRFFPLGADWKPGSHLEIKIFGEPQSSDGELSSTGAWRAVGTLTVNSFGTFGFDPNPLTFTAPRGLCGFPPATLSSPLVLARDTGTGLVRLTTVDSGFWFTLHPCS
jgi:hypothetical protein